MKFFKWRIFIITSIVCLLPILFGVALWNDLPDFMAIHFDINGNPDNFASKGFAVIALPGIMLAGQVLCCFVTDVNAKKHGKRKKFELVLKWIMPVMSTVLQTITVGFGLGWNVDIRKPVVLLVGTIFVVVGNYLPKLDYVKNYNLDTYKARKINRFMGFASVIMGLLFMLSIFFDAIVSVIVLITMFVCMLVCVIYSVVVIKSKKQ
jgi:uncharacterized membrane protein